MICPLFLSTLVLDGFTIDFIAFFISKSRHFLTIFTHSVHLSTSICPLFNKIVHFFVYYKLIVYFSISLFSAVLRRYLCL